MLDYTPKEIKERTVGLINPAKTCQPIGAIYAALGIHGCLPHSHGSQGCCSYHRMHLTRHFRDPIMASTSSFTEGASVFGGGSNLKTAIKNIFQVYDPEVIAIHTTCLTETIGDDIPNIIKTADIPAGKTVFHANTPSYQGSHITGFSNMTKAMVKYFSQASTPAKKDQVNIVPGFVNPGDMREIKRLTAQLGIPYIMFPDTCGVVDTPLTGEYQMFPKGGVTLDQLADAGNSRLTLALGRFASFDAADTLEKKCQVPVTLLKTPIGVKATDDMIMALIRTFGGEVPAELEEERGQLVDIMTDTHFHFHGKKVAIFGDPDVVTGLTEFVVDLGMKPVHVLTGTPGGAIGSDIGSFEEDIVEIVGPAAAKQINIKAGGDLFLFHQWLKNEPADLIIGNTYGKYIARAEDIPLVRVGFPILDRSVHSYFPITGYRGAMRLLEMISNALLERQDRDAAEEDFELVM